MRFAASLLACILFLAAGCTSTDDDSDDWMLGANSYQMVLSGVPTAPVAPGSMFNVSVQASMGMGMGMHRMTSDHIGAHFWNMTMMDPTGGLGTANTCQHQADEAPGEWMAQCTAPMQPGTYHIRSHMRMMDGNGQMQHWWSGEQTFMVA